MRSHELTPPDVSGRAEMQVGKGDVAGALGLPMVGEDLVLFSICK